MTFGVICCNSMVKRCFCNCKFLEFPQLGTTIAFDTANKKQNIPAVEISRLATSNILLHKKPEVRDLSLKRSACG